MKQLFAFTAGSLLVVGAIAAAPFTGGGSILGTATLATSLLGIEGITAALAVGGGLLTAQLFNEDKEQYLSHINEARAQAIVIEKKLSHFRDSESFQTALYMLGIAAAREMNDLSNQMLETIATFAFGIGYEYKGEEFQQRLHAIRKQAPNLSTTLAFIQNNIHHSYSLNIFRKMIEIAIEASQHNKETGKKFLKEFDRVTNFNS